MPFLFGGALGLVLLALWLYVILEVVTTDASLCRNLPKPLWLLLVIVLPDIGSLVWLIAGRPQNKGFGIGGGPPRNSRPPTHRPAPLGIEDRPDWPGVSDKLLGHEPAETVDPEVEKQKIRDAADERVRKLREWESRLIQREKDLDDRSRDQPRNED
jgi:hypothetical protein